ncbi:MAG: TRAP transporter substrate-binding protein [Desulfovibrio sp.]|jgi:TRAP-type mannitol/chloroaromatic compound transport system substrate-binding protein
MKKLGVFFLSMCVATGCFAGSAMAKEKLQIQTALANSSIYMRTLERFKANVEKLSKGELEVELLAAGAIVKPFEIYGAVSEGLVNGGMGWTHYNSGVNPAGTLFSAPCGGIGYGLDQASVMSWIFEGDGGKLLNRYYQEACKQNIVAFAVLPMGPEAFGWFKQTYKSLAEINKLKFRCPPGVPAEIFHEMGMPAVSMGGPDIIPAAQKGVIDCAEWIAPAEDLAMGFDQIWKHLYLQGLHQALSIGDVVLNKTWYDKLPEHLRDILNVCLKLCVVDQNNDNIKRHSIALKDMVENRGVVLDQTPPEYYNAFMKATRAVFDRYAAKDAFFKEVYENEIAWAKLTVPFQMRANGLYYTLGKTAMDDGLITDYKK